MGVVAEPVQGGRGSVWLGSGKATGCVGGKEPCQGHNTPGKAPDMMSFLQNLTSYHWVHCTPFLRMLPPQRSPNSMCSCLRFVPATEVLTLECSYPRMFPEGTGEILKSRAGSCQSPLTGLWALSSGLRPLLCCPTLGGQCPLSGSRVAR